MPSTARAVLCASLFTLSGCKLGPNFSVPNIFTPSTWLGTPSASPSVAGKISETPPDPQWWKILQDPELSALESRLAASTFDVRLAVLRLGESRAQAAIAGADRFPTLDASGSYTKEKVSSEGVLGLLGGSPNPEGSFASGGSSANGTSGRQGAFPTSTATHGASIPAFDLFQYGFDASWEADLWGRVSRSVESAKANVDMQLEQARGTLVSAQAELARDYIRLRGVQASMRITRKNIDTAKQSLELSRERFKGGLTTELDVVNASAQEALTESSLPQLRQQQAQLVNAISMLLGEGPQTLTAELTTSAETADVPSMPPRAPIGLPADLARRRPDIRGAEAQLHAATADVGVAIADFYPRLTLDGSFGFQALQFKNLADWNARQFGFGPSLSLPIFQGGRLHATLQLRERQQQEAALHYQQTVLQAWHDVDNALTAYITDQERADDLARVVTQTHHALDLAQQRYRQGVADFLNVLDSERDVFNAEQQLSQSRTDVGTDLVALYKARGGGWQPSK